MINPREIIMKNNLNKQLITMYEYCYGSLTIHKRKSQIEFVFILTRSKHGNN